MAVLRYYGSIPVTDNQGLAMLKQVTTDIIEPLGAIVIMKAEMPSGAILCLWTLDGSSFPTLHYLGDLHDPQAIEREIRSSIEGRAETPQQTSEQAGRGQATPADRVLQASEGLTLTDLDNLRYYTCEAYKNGLTGHSYIGQLLAKLEGLSDATLSSQRITDR